MFPTPCVNPGCDDGCGPPVVSATATLGEGTAPGTTAGGKTVLCENVWYVLLFY